MLGEGGGGVDFLGLPRPPANTSRYKVHKYVLAFSELENPRIRLNDNLFTLVFEAHTSLYRLI